MENSESSGKISEVHTQSILSSNDVTQTSFLCVLLNYRFGTQLPTSQFPSC